MRSQGTENSITRQAADPAALAKPLNAVPSDGTEKRRVIQKIADFPMSVRIQALALAEASISYDRVREITGIEAKLLDKLRKTARDRGYDPNTSMQIHEGYVADPVNKGHSKPKKQRQDGILQNGIGQTPADRVIPGYVQADTTGLPPGNWNFMATAQVHSGSSLA